MNNASVATTRGGAQPCPAQLYDVLPLALVQTLSFLANGLAAISIWRLPGLEENKNHLIVRSLVVSDLLIPLPMLPFSIASYSRCEWLGGRAVCVLTAFLSTVFLSWSVFIVLVLCVLRYLAVTRPLWYRKHVTLLRVKIALFVAFLWACGHLLLPAAGIGKFRLYEKGFYCALDLTPDEPRDKALVYLVILEGLICTAALLYSCVVIISSLVRRRRRVSEQLSVNHRGSVGLATQMRRQHEGYARLTLAIVVLFCVCYVPFVMYRLLLVARGPGAFSPWSYYCTELLAHVSPLCNPVVYVLCNRQYRACVRKLLAKCCCCLPCCNRDMMYDRGIELRKMSAFSTRTESILLD